MLLFAGESFWAEELGAKIIGSRLWALVSFARGGSQLHQIFVVEVTLTLSITGGSQGLGGGGEGVRSDPVELLMESVQQQCQEFLTVMLEEKQTRNM